MLFKSLILKSNSNFLSFKPKTLVKTLVCLAKLKKSFAIIKFENQSL